MIRVIAVASFFLLSCVLLSFSLRAQVPVAITNEVFAPENGRWPDEQVSSFPFATGQMIVSFANAYSRLYYFDGQDIQEVLTDGEYIVRDLGAVPGGRILYLEGEAFNQSVYFLSETDLSFTPLTNAFGDFIPSAVATDSGLILYRNLGSGVGLLALHVTGNPAENTELFRADSGAFTVDREAGFWVFSLLNGGIYLTDGTPARTYRIFDFVPPPANRVRLYEGEYYFIAENRFQAFDPTTETTRTLRTIEYPSGLTPFTLFDFTVTPAGIVYIADAAGNGTELFIHEGTSASARLLRGFGDFGADGVHGHLPGFFEEETLLDGWLTFVVLTEDDSLHEIWQTDGTEAGTVQIGTQAGRPESITFTYYGNEETGDIYLSTIANNWPNENELSLYGMRRADAVPRFQLVDSLPIAFIDDSAFAGDWFLYAARAVDGDSWTSYRLADGARQRFTDGSKPQLMFGVPVQDGRAFFPSFRSGFSRNPVSLLLGRDTVTTLYEVPANESNQDVHFFSLNEETYFLANDLITGLTVFQTDGTLAGTRQVLDVHDLVRENNFGRISKVDSNLVTVTNLGDAYLIDPTNDSLQLLAANVRELEEKTDNGYYVYTNRTSSNIQLVSDTQHLNVKTFYPDLARFSRPVTVGNEVVFINQTAPQATWQLVCFDTQNRDWRTFFLPGTGNQNPSNASNIIFRQADTVHLTILVPGENSRFFRYIYRQELRELTGFGPFVGRLAASLRGGNGTPASISIESLQTGVVNTYLYDAARDTFQLFSSDPFSRWPTHLAALPEAVLVLTPDRLSRTVSLTDFTESTAAPLVQSTNADNPLNDLTDIGNGTFAFVRKNDTSTEVWRSDGTPSGTQIMRTLPGELRLSSDGLVTEETWLLLRPVSGRSQLHYAYQPATDNLLPVDFNLPETTLLGDITGFAGRFYFTTTELFTTRGFYLDIIGVNTEETAVVFTDENENGLLDPNEMGVPGQPIRFVFPEETLTTFTDGEGRYTRIGPTDTDYTLQVIPTDCWRATTVDSLDLSPVDTLPDFGLVLDDGRDAISVNLSSAPVRCGFTVPFWISATNVGCQTLTGFSIVLNLDAEVVLDSFLIAPTQRTDSVLSWTLDSLPVGASWQNQLFLVMPDETRAGEEIPFTAVAQGLTRTNVIIQDSVSYTPTLRCAIDPNDKLVSPTRTENNYTQIDETLTYTIRFQNTGNDTALNVRLEDQLDPQLDLKTFRPLAASHAYRVELADNGLLQVFFDDIFLPDSNANYQASNGFFAFTIDLLETALDQTVDNTAGIYFDFNAPVITNTVTSTIVEFLDEDEDNFFFWEDCDDGNPAINPAAFDTGGNGIDEDCDGNDWTTSVHDPLPGDLSLFPNPTNGLLQVRYSLPSDLLLEVFDGRGRRMQSEVFKSDVQLNLSDLPSAIYQLKLTDRRSGQFTSRRVVVSR